MANGTNGQQRGPDGKFLPGNRAAAGRTHPHAARVAVFRKTLLETVTETDLAEVVQAVLQNAKQGSEWACKLILDRCVGAVPTFADLELSDRLAALEERLAGDER